MLEVSCPSHFFYTQGYNPCPHREMSYFTCTQVQVLVCSERRFSKVCIMPEETCPLHHGTQQEKCPTTELIMTIACSMVSFYFTHVCDFYIIEHSKKYARSSHNYGYKDYNHCNSDSFYFTHSFCQNTEIMTALMPP